MRDKLLEADEALQALVQELGKFKSASENLALAGDNVAKLQQSTEKLVGLSAEIAKYGQQQVEQVERFATGTERRLAQITEDQKIFTVATEKRLMGLSTEIVEHTQQHLDSTTRLAAVAERRLNLILTLTIILFLMMAANLILAYWIMQLVIS